MKKFEAYNLIDINKKKGFPRTYRFNQFVRWLVIFLSILAIAYAIYYIFNAIDQDSSTLKKIVPFIIIFLAIHSLLRNLFSLNSILFLSEGIEFRYIANKSVFIRWEIIIKLALY